MLRATQTHLHAVEGVQARHHPRVSQRGTGSEDRTASDRGPRGRTSGWCKAGKALVNFCFRVFLGDTECSFSNIRMKKKYMCVSVCLSQNGYYDLMIIKSISE